MTHKEKVVIEEVLPHLYRAEIPLPDTVLKGLNSYIIKGERTLIIDTGMNVKICLSAITYVINKLGIDLNRTDFFITHAHPDHMGLVASLAPITSKIYFNQTESKQTEASFMRWAEASSILAHCHGYYHNRFKEMISNATPGDKKAIYPDYFRFSILKENDTINIDDYSFRVIETPGHTRGHMCLYESQRQIFISGDHILGDITPNISSRFNFEEDPLQEYLSSLNKVYPLDVKLVLPGHRSILTDLKGRIRELIAHHEERLNEVLAILGKGNQNAFRIASQMTWDMSYETWEEFPFYPKWFAFDETLTHLHYLEALGKVRQIVLPDQQVIYSLS